MEAYLTINLHYEKNIRLLDFQFQTDDEHAARRVERILAVRGVDAAVHLVEDVVDADARLQVQVLQAVNRVAGVEVPDAVAGRILVVGIVGLGLHAAIDVYIQPIVAPTMVIVGGDSGRMADAALQRCPLVIAV